MKKSAATSNMPKGRRVPADNSKNTALRKASNKQPAVEGKKAAPAAETVTLTQSEFDAIIGAVGKLTMEKGK